MQFLGYPSTYVVLIVGSRLLPAARTASNAYWLPQSFARTRPPPCKVIWPGTQWAKGERYWDLECKPEHSKASRQTAVTRHMRLNLCLAELLDGAHNGFIIQMVGVSKQARLG